jgi:hypothetical protein
MDHPGTAGQVSRSVLTGHASALVLAIVWLLFGAGVYLPDIGRGFIKDDFGWVAAGAEAMSSPASVFTADQSGTFYRPLVTLTFAADHALYGLHSRGYGFTNLLLYAVCVLLIFAVLRRLDVGVTAAAAGAFAWAVNPSGIDMAVLWLSGRTSLLMTAFSCGSLLLFLRKQQLAGTIACMGALLCKEDAIALPIIILGGLWFSRADSKEMVRSAGALAIAEIVYFYVRAGTHAITVADAPDFYRLTWDPIVIAVNVLHYVDRSATSTAVLAVAALAVYGRRPVFEGPDRRRLVFGFVWFISGLIITARVPVRSTLYAVFPSVAAAIVLATLIDRLQSGTRSPSAEWRLQAVFASVLLLIPLYGIRNDRWVEPARVSARTMKAVGSQAPPNGGTIVFEDEPVRFSNFTDAFGGAETLAVRLFTGRNIDARVVLPGTGGAVSREAIRFRLIHGAVVRAD